MKGNDTMYQDERLYARIFHRGAKRRDERPNQKGLVTFHRGALRLDERSRKSIIIFFNGLYNKPLKKIMIVCSGFRLDPMGRDESYDN